MSKINNVAFESALDMRREIKAVMRDGARAEAILLAPYQVSFDWDGQRWRLTAPAGFAAAPSVPPKLQGLVGFWGALFEGSIIHDWCYYTRCFDPLTGGEGRRIADKLLRALMLAGNARPDDVAEVYTAVRIFGGDLYKANSIKPDSGLIKL